MILNNQKISILEEFLRDYSIKLTGSFIAKKRKLNQKSVSNFLKALEKQSFLKSTAQGKNKLYFLNMQDELSIVNFISSIEHERTINFYQKKPLIKEIISKIRPYYDGIAIIFGSYAKNLEKEGSDLDLFVAGKCNVNEIERISKIYNIEINIKHYPSLLKETDYLIEEIIKDHIIIDGIQIFVQAIIKWKRLNGAFV